MKRRLLILLLFPVLPLFSQEDPATLAQKITASCTSEKQKVTAIFKWITENIAYRTHVSTRVRSIGKQSAKYAKEQNDEADTGALKPLSVRVSETVLQKREAVCEGYSRLFTTLCEFAGIRSEIIIGYARPSANKPVSRFGVNHYWNAVLIGGDWKLLDVTWSSGYISSRGGEFIREYDPAYFLTSPDDFIKDHYPDDIRWTLLPASRLPGEFFRSPFRQKSFNKYSIASYYPTSGIIEAAIGDTIRLELATTDADRDKVIAPDLLVDSTIFSHSDSWIFLKPAKETEDQPFQNRHSYAFAVTKPGIEWLYLMYNDDMVLRYKVNVRQPKPDEGR
ncbi:MAG: transglutaminase domain-containing protein [Chitinophagaceae bacterium]